MARTLTYYKGEQVQDLEVPVPVPVPVEPSTGSGKDGAGGGTENGKANTVQENTEENTEEDTEKQTVPIAEENIGENTENCKNSILEGSAEENTEVDPAKSSSSPSPGSVEEGVTLSIRGEAYHFTHFFVVSSLLFFAAVFYYMSNTFKSENGANGQKWKFIKFGVLCLLVLGIIVDTEPSHPVSSAMSWTTAATETSSSSSSSSSSNTTPDPEAEAPPTLSALQAELLATAAEFRKVYARCATLNPPTLRDSGVPNTALPAAVAAASALDAALMLWPEFAGTLVLLLLLLLLLAATC